MNNEEIKMTKELGVIQSIEEVLKGELIINNINYAGYKVTTDTTTISFMIDVEYGSEDCGYSMVDAAEDFIGAKVEDVSLCDVADSDDIALDILTDKGVLRLWVYNNSTEHQHIVVATIGNKVILEENI